MLLFVLLKLQNLNDSTYIIYKHVTFCSIIITKTSRLKE